MKKIAGSFVVLLFTLLLFGCGEDNVLPEKEPLPLENKAPLKFGVDVLGVFHDRGTITWGPIVDIDKDPVYQSVFLENNLVLDRSTTDSILTIKNLKPLTEYHGKVVVTDDKHNPLEVPFSFTTRKYWLTFDRLYNGVDGNQPAAHAVARTKDGGYVIFGEAAIGFKSGIYVFKVDSLGSELWHSVHGYVRRAQNMKGTISETSDGGYIVASQESLLKLDKNGSAQWQALDESEEHYYYEYNFNAAVETDDHGFLVVGSLQKSGKDVKGIITKFNASGVVQWKKEFGTEDITFVRSICRTADGNYQILGSSYMDGTPQRPAVTAITEDGAILWSKVYENGSMYDFPEKITATREGGSIFISNYVNGLGTRFAKVIKLGNAGNVQWEKVFQWDSFETSVYGIVEVSDGYVLAGNDGDARPSAGLLFKIKSTGALDWKRTFRASYMDYLWILWDILESDDGGFFAIGGKGAVYSYTDKELGLWMLKTNDEGYALK